MILIYRFITDVFPKVKNTLRYWEEKARNIPDPILSEQALASIQSKEFHCLGGSIYGLYPGTNTDEMVDFIVAYQTISDYLDNLVDAANVCDEAAFAQLHLAMSEALEPEGKLSDYYALYPYQNDGGYLNSLVQRCQKTAMHLPSYSLVKKDMLGLAKLYSSLQTTKHLDSSIREDKMLAWIQKYVKDYPNILEWEFAAATGSTLGIFCLHALAFDPNLESNVVQKVNEAYFPWISGLHILLDYFIDLLEDRNTAQLNFVEYYYTPKKTEERLLFILQNSLTGAKELSHAKFHQTVIKGLLAMYLSDTKGQLKEMISTTKTLIKAGGMEVQILYSICVRLRKRNIL